MAEEKKKRNTKAKPGCRHYIVRNVKHPHQDKWVAAQEKKGLSSLRDWIILTLNKAAEEELAQDGP